MIFLFAVETKTYLDGVGDGFIIGWCGALLVWVVFATRDRGPQ